MATERRREPAPRENHGQQAPKEWPMMHWLPIQAADYRLLVVGDLADLPCPRTPQGALWPRPTVSGSSGQPGVQLPRNRPPRNSVNPVRPQLGGQKPEPVERRQRACALERRSPRVDCAASCSGFCPRAADHWVTLFEEAGYAGLNTGLARRSRDGRRGQRAP